MTMGGPLSKVRRMACGGPYTGLLRCTTAVLISAVLSACTVGPDYHRPDVAMTPAFKEVAGWTLAQPSDSMDKGPWWRLFDDPVLNDLEARVEVSNQTLAAAEAAYRQARAVVAADRSQLFPTVNLTSGATGGRSLAGGAQTTTGATSHLYQVGAEASWAPDLWGKIRRQVEAAGANAQASAGDLANLRLLAQGQLAIAYVQLRSADAQKDLFRRTIAAYERSLHVVEIQFQAGAAPKSSVLSAQSTLSLAKANLIDLDRQRTQAEHAIAVLMGAAPATVTIAPEPDWKPTPPDVPVLTPSTLLERRPDIAAAERRMAAANAQIGAAVAAYYPNLNLLAGVGGEGTSIASLFSAPQLLWSLGASAAETVLDFGARKAAVAQARASYDQTVANYRQTVLTALQGVEDALAAAHILAGEEAYYVSAASDADQSERLALAEFQGGRVDYITVANAQAAALNAHVSLLALQAQRSIQTVDLLQAFGGGWRTVTTNSS